MPAAFDSSRDTTVVIRREDVLAGDLHRLPALLFAVDSVEMHRGHGDRPCTVTVHWGGWSYAASPDSGETVGHVIDYFARYFVDGAPGWPEQKWGRDPRTRTAALAPPDSTR